MDGESIDPRRILHFMETLYLEKFPSPATVSQPISIDLTQWEKPKLSLPDKNFSSQTPFCPGCGLGILRNCLVESIQELNLPKEKIMIASGIGCTARLSNHLPFDSANTTHGYAIPFATGVKLTQPDLNVVVVSGDGDLFDIGCGQTIHGARRNLPMLTICFNNFVFGMTGGQAGATTPLGAITSTTSQGNQKPPLDLVKLMLDLDVGFVARCPISKPLLLKQYIKEALEFKGFSFIEVVSPCFTGYGRRNGLTSPHQIWQKLNQTYIDKKQVQGLTENAVREKFRVLLPSRSKFQSPELLQVVYGKFSTLKEYISLTPEEQK